MKRKHLIIILIGLALWLAETAAYGWNKKPGSAGEGALDYIALIIILWGVVGDVMSGVRITKNYHNVTTHRINTKRVDFTGDKPHVTTKQTIKVNHNLKPGTSTLAFREPNK